MESETRRFLATWADGMVATVTFSPYGYRWWCRAMGDVRSVGPHSGPLELTIRWFRQEHKPDGWYDLDELLSRPTREERDAAVAAEREACAADLRETLAERTAEGGAACAALVEAFVPADERDELRCAGVLRLVAVAAEAAARLTAERDTLRVELTLARHEVGEGWFAGGATLAEAIRRKTSMLERLGEPTEVPVCPGCHAVGEAPCAEGCIDAEIAEESRGVAGDSCHMGQECGRVGCPECQQ